jgi:hypothetical protein
MQDTFYVEDPFSTAESAARDVYTGLGYVKRQ